MVCGNAEPVRRAIRPWGRLRCWCRGASEKCSQGVATGWTTSRTSCSGFPLAIRTAIPDLVEWAWAASMAGWLAQGLSAESACSGSS